MSNKDRFYGSSAWKSIRAAVFQRDAYRCVDCGAVGKQVGGVARLTADHTGISLAEWAARGNRKEAYPQLWIVTRCDKCHGRKDGARARRR